jgi:hypothetical protein
LADGSKSKINTVAALSVQNHKSEIIYPKSSIKNRPVLHEKALSFEAAIK